MTNFSIYWARTDRYFLISRRKANRTDYLYREKDSVKYYGRSARLNYLKNLEGILIGMIFSKKKDWGLSIEREIEVDYWGGICKNSIPCRREKDS